MSTEVRFETAKVAVVRKQYTVTVGKVMNPVITGEINDEAEVSKLVGKADVVAAVSGKNIVGIGQRGPLCYWILCYIPTPDILKGIRPEIRQRLVAKLVAEKVIDKAFAKELSADRLSP